MLEVRHGLKALIIRSVFYSLVEIAETSPEDDKNDNKNKYMEKILAVSSQGCKFELGRFQG